MKIQASLQKYHHYYGDSFRIECPTGSGRFMTLWEVASELSRRMVSLFRRDASQFYLKQYGLYVG